jgi:hypothetical protein
MRSSKEFLVPALQLVISSSYISMRINSQGCEMAQSTKTTPVKGGWVQRESTSGRFVAVHSSSGTAKASKVSSHTIKEVSKARSSAMKRLADR